MYIHVPKDEKCPPRKLNNVCYPSYFKKPTNGICWKENVINVYWWQRITDHDWTPEPTSVLRIALLFVLL